MIGRAIVLGVVVAGLVAGPAFGHAVVQPASARPADPQLYTLVVPNELGGDTVDVRVKVPEGIDFLLLEQPPEGWRGEVIRKGDTISELRWTGGKSPEDQFVTFRWLARNPVMEGEITWPTVQRYADGQVQRWIGPEGSDAPAPRTVLSESATPTDVLAVGGEKVAEAGAAPAAAAKTAAAAPEDDEGLEFDDILPIALSGLALLVALAAFFAGRRATSASRSA